MRRICIALTVALLVPTTALGWTHREHRVRRTIALTLQHEGVSRPNRLAALKLAYRESTYRPWARNHSCLGLFQLKTHSSRWADPVWNTRRANRYVVKRYGTWQSALTHSYSKGWY